MSFTDLFSEKSATYARARPTYPDALYRFVAGVRYSVQPAEATRFEAASFDTVCVAQAMHWFDLERFYAEVRRVLRPGGVIAVWGYGWTKVSPQVDRAFARHLLAKIKPYWPEQNALLIAGYKTIPFPFEPIEAPALAIEVSWTIEGRHVGA